jgi:hypothetical protein
MRSSFVGLCLLRLLPLGAWRRAPYFRPLRSRMGVEKKKKWGARFEVPVFWSVSFRSLHSLLAVFSPIGAYELLVGIFEGEDCFGDVVGLVFGGVFVFAVFGSVPFREGEFSDGKGFSVGGSLVFPDAGAKGADLAASKGLVWDVDFWNSLLVVLHVVFTCFVFFLIANRCYMVRFAG